VVDGCGGAIIIVVVHGVVNIGITVIVLCSLSGLSSWGAVKLDP